MKNVLELFTRPIAHRGLHQGSVVENSLAAFKAAIDLGVGFELDVHMLKDGTIVVHHDYNLKRLCGVDARLADLTLEELKRHKFIEATETVPTFQEVLDLTAGKVPILVELKISNGFDPAFPDALLQTLESYPFKDTIALQSFNPYAVRYLKNQASSYPVGQLSSGKLEGQKPHIQFLFATMLVNRISKPDFVSYDVNYLPRWSVTRLRKRGMPIIAWTIDDENKRKNAVANADQFIFEGIKI